MDPQGTHRLAHARRAPDRVPNREGLARRGGAI
jgi:hypothetical protein